MGRRRRRRNQLLVDLKENRGAGIWKRTHDFAHRSKLALKDAMNLSLRQLWNGRIYPKYWQLQGVRIPISDI